MFNVIKRLLSYFAQRRFDNQQLYVTLSNVNHRELHRLDDEF